MNDQHGRPDGSVSDAALEQPAAGSLPAMQPSPAPSAPPHESAMADATAEAAEEPVPVHSDDETACMADRSASASSVGASSDGSAAAAAPDVVLAAPPGSFCAAPADPSEGLPTGAADEADLRDPPAHVDLGYLTDGVAAYIASLRDRLRQTQADLLTVPAQELRSALAVRQPCNPPCMKQAVFLCML